MSESQPKICPFCGEPPQALFAEMREALANLWGMADRIRSSPATADSQRNMLLTVHPAEFITFAKAVDSARAVLRKVSER